MTVYSPFLLDFLIVAGILLLGIVAMHCAYRAGGPVWRDKYSFVRAMPDGSKIRVRGERGEIAMAVLAAGILVLVNRFTPDLTLIELVSDRIRLVVVAGLGLFVIVQAYGYFKSGKLARENADVASSISSFRRAYLLYAIYSTVNYGFIFLAVAATWVQFGADIQRFADQQEQVGRLLSAMSENPHGVGTSAASDLFARIETIYGETLIGSRLAIDQVNTLLLILMAALVPGLLLNLTSLREVFEADSVRISNIVSVGAACLVFVLGWFIYFNGYAPFIENSVIAIEGAKDIAAAGKSGEIERYYEILLELNRVRGGSGFLITLTSERGGFILVLGALQLLVSWWRTFQDNRHPTGGK